MEWKEYEIDSKVVSHNSTLYIHIPQELADRKDIQRGDRIKAIMHEKVRDGKHLDLVFIPTILKRD